jgi:hypothetical protein
MKRVRGILVVSAVVVLYAVSSPAQSDDRNARKFTLALIGDIPYSGLQVAQYPNVIADINNAKVDFTVHVGDIKAGDTLCSNEVYADILESFNTFAKPLVYTPGDNEWTDCHRTSPNNGGYDPIERLAFLRSVFYTSNDSFGKTTMTLRRQSEDPGVEAYPENAMWSVGSALFATVHMVGSNNGLNQTSSCVPANAVLCPNPFMAAMNAEYAARNAANLAWIQRAFATAAARGFAGVMFLTQANLNMDRVTTDANRTGFNDAIALLRRETVAFGRPVVLVHGDSHYVRIDQPLTDLDPTTNGTLRGRRIENFTRVEVFGNPDAHWLEVTVDPHNRTVFTFQLRTVAANIVPH